MEDARRHTRRTNLRLADWIPICGTIGYYARNYSFMDPTHENYDSRLHDMVGGKMTRLVLYNTIMFGGATCLGASLISTGIEKFF